MSWFESHPLKSRYESFSASERAGAEAEAARDVAAALPGGVLPEPVPELLTAAIREQALFLLLNPLQLTGEAAGPVLGPRARAYVEAAAGPVRLVR